MSVTIKTEHNGPKNGGGYWGPRNEAKRLSRRARRMANRDAIRESLAAEIPDDEACEFR